MNILIKQIKKDMWEAEFEILENNNVIGKISLKGNIGSMEASIQGNFYDNNFSLECVNPIFAGTPKRFRPYNILKNNNLVGEVFDTRVKKNIFSYYDYKKCIYDGNEYSLYSIGLGSENAIILYHNDTQIAQIKKSNVIYDDLYNFDIYTSDKQNAYISIIMCCHMYVIGYYKAGVKVTKSKCISFSKTTNKELLSKYNPDWIKQFIEQ